MPSKQDHFERIVMPEAARLLRFALRLTHDTPAAEDLVQDTLYKAWRSFDQFQSGTSARAWVFRILVNSFYEQARKIRPVPDLSITAGSSVAQRVEIEQALDTLSPEHRTVLLLGVVEGFTCREVAEILSVPVGTVMSRLSRARQAMRAQLCEKVFR